jgi:metaxin
MTEADGPPPEQTSWRSWFALPEPLRRVFAQFPLLSCNSNPLPQAAPRIRNQHVFYSFQRPQDGAHAPSCNPTCLKWQALLRFHNIDHHVQSSNNHASPSGALPFLLPASSALRPATPVSATKIPRWVTGHGGREEKIHSHEEAYSALLDHDIRNAWLYFLYLDPSNFKTVASPLYCSSASSNFLVQQAIGSQLRSAARDELLKSYSLIDGSDLYEHAAHAFRSLSVFLGDDNHFFGSSSPGLFDASVFAYTHLLLDESMNWTNTVLIDLLREHENLVEHRERLLSTYFS